MDSSPEVMKTIAQGVINSLFPSELSGDALGDLAAIYVPDFVQIGISTDPLTSDTSFHVNILNDNEFNVISDPKVPK